MNADEKEAALAEGWSLMPFVDLTGNRFDDAPVVVPGSTVEALGFGVYVEHEATIVEEDAAPRQKRQKGAR